MSKWNFFQGVDLSEEGRPSPKIRALLEFHAVTDVRAKYGHRVYFDCAEISNRVLQDYFSRVSRIKTTRQQEVVLPLFIFEGEVKGGLPHR